MNVAYAPLLQLKLRHDFFADGSCPPVTMVPCQTSARMMSTLGWQFLARQHSNATVVCPQHDGTPPSSLTDGRPMQLSFWLRYTDPTFINYTDIPIRQQDNSAYFASNQTNNEVCFATNEADRLPLHRPDSQLTSDLPAGVYTIENADTGQPETVLLATDGYQRGDLGLVTIYLGDPANGSLISPADGTITPISFTTSFRARATYWRYYLIGDKHHDFQISGGAFSAVESPETLRILKGRQATVLASLHPLHLRQRPDLNLLLTAASKSGQADLSPMRLPTAATNQVRIDPNSEAVFSDIYVWL